MRTDSDEDAGGGPGPAEPKAEAASEPAIFSRRAQVMIAELHHSLGQEMKALATHHTRFQGALLACNVETQTAMLQTYRDQLHSVLSVVSRLCITVDKRI